jgi:biotin carboxyl carrier protein
MKMRNEVLAPVAGVVRKIHVSEGEMVPKSHLLLEMD